MTTRTIRCVRTSTSRAGRPRSTSAVAPPRPASAIWTTTDGPEAGLRAAAPDASRSAGAGGRPARRADGGQHGTVAPLDPRGAAARAVARRRDRPGGAAAPRLPAPRDGEDRRDDDLPPVHPVHRPPRLPGAAVEQRRLRAGGREAAGDHGAAEGGRDP